MKRRIRDMWVKALRSGGYKQCRFSLTDKRKNQRYYCCLGVLSQLYCNENNVDIDDIDVNDGLLCKEVRDWAGLNSYNPYLISEDGKRKYASDLNDDFKYSFKQIADSIKRTFR